MRHKIRAARWLTTLVLCVLFLAWVGWSIGRATELVDPAPNATPQSVPGLPEVR